LFIFAKNSLSKLLASVLCRNTYLFVDPSVKINEAYYGNMLLLQMLQLTTLHVLGEFFVFQRDNAPTQGAWDNQSSGMLSNHPFW